MRLAKPAEARGLSLCYALGSNYHSPLLESRAQTGLGNLRKYRWCCTTNKIICLLTHPARVIAVIESQRFLVAVETRTGSLIFAIWRLCDHGNYGTPHTSRRARAPREHRILTTLQQQHARGRHMTKLGDVIFSQAWLIHNSGELARVLEITLGVGWTGCVVWWRVAGGTFRLSTLNPFLQTPHRHPHPKIPFFSVCTCMNMNLTYPIRKNIKVLFNLKFQLKIM